MGRPTTNTQVSQVENFLTQQVDLLLISPFEAAPLTPVVTRVYKAGLPVIELDRKTSGEDYTSFVGGDNREIAKQAGEYAAKTLLPDGGEVAILEGLPSSSPAIERLEGFKDGIKGSDKLKVVAVQPVDWMEDKAVTVFSAMLQAHPDIKLVYASNDLAASGAYIAAKQVGKTDQVTDHRHRRPAGAVRRHPLGRRGAVGGNHGLPDRRGRSPRSRQEDPDRLRHLGAPHRDRPLTADQQGQCQGSVQERAVLRLPRCNAL